MDKKWKDLGKSVAYAAVGATAFGALHFMFLGTYLAPQPTIMGIEPAVWGAIGLGAVAYLAAAFAGKKLGDAGEKVFLAGGTAMVAYGVARQMGWIAKGPAATIGAIGYRPATLKTPATYPVTMGANTAMSVNGGTKLI